MSIALVNEVGIEGMFYFEFELLFDLFVFSSILTLLSSLIIVELSISLYRESLIARAMKIACSYLVLIWLFVAICSVCPARIDPSDFFSGAKKSPRLSI